jgi:hypothetical protein
MTPDDIDNGRSGSIDAPPAGGRSQPVSGFHVKATMNVARVGDLVET